jgi:3-deoxy-D-manno-octulosonic-acid transferase
MTLRLYGGLAKLAEPLAGQLIARRLKRGKEDPQRVPERRGIASVTRPAGEIVWIHGASVGEILAAAGLIEQMHTQGFTILLTSGTVTSSKIAQSRFGDQVIHQFIPYDTPGFVTRFLDHWRPSLALFIESDIWPNIVRHCALRRVPMILINGRLSERSFARWRRAPATIASLLGRFDLCLAQSDGDAERFRQLGVQRVATSGNLKLDVPPPPADDEACKSLQARLRGRPLILAASTHPGEEEVLIDAHHRLSGHFPGLMTIVVPRHPQRGPAIAQMAASTGLKVGLRSLATTANAQTDFYIADTIGELGLFYRAAPIVFMGGSLVSHGGQNPIEAIKLGAAIIHGPNVWNFRDVYRALDEADGALPVADAEELVARLDEWLGDAKLHRQCGLRARHVVENLGGALARTLNELEPYLMQLRLEARPGYA